MQTTIYVSSESSTALIKHVRKSIKFDLKNRFFPELEHIQTNDLSITAALTPSEILAKCPDLVGTTIVTTSEHIILWFQKQVRTKMIQPQNLRIIAVRETGEAQQVTIDEDGSIDYPGKFFTDRLPLLID